MFHFPPSPNPVRQLWLTSMHLAAGMQTMVSISRGDRARTYYNVSPASCERLARAVNRIQRREVRFIIEPTIAYPGWYARLPYPE